MPPVADRELRDEPNVLLHYRRLADDVHGQITWLAEFIGIDPASLDMDVIAEHCSFDYKRPRRRDGSVQRSTHVQRPSLLPQGAHA